MLGRPDWSASVGRGAAENDSTGSVHQELHSVVALVTYCMGNKWVTVAGSAVSPNLAIHGDAGSQPGCLSDAFIKPPAQTH